VLRLAVSSLLTVVVACLSAHASDEERAITWTADDTRLQWGPCPAFLPAGCRIAVLHGDPAKSNADVFFKLPANSQLPLHWHTSAERMVLVAGELRVTYEGQSAATLKPGTYAYGPAKRAHSGSCISAVPCVLFIAFESPVDAVPK
jgi:quercetin dioxygenase-like cupin family protein